MLDWAQVEYDLASIVGRTALANFGSAFLYLGAISGTCKYPRQLLPRLAHPPYPTSAEGEGCCAVILGSIGGTGTQGLASTRMSSMAATQTSRVLASAMEDRAFFTTTTLIMRFLTVSMEAIAKNMVIPC